MSEKNEIMALRGTEVAAGIDMRLSKGDIIDMVVEERKAELEEQLKGLLAQNEPLMLEFRNAGIKYEKQYEAEFQKQHKALIESFKKAFPKSTMEVRSSSNHRHFVEKKKEGRCFHDQSGEEGDKVEVACNIRLRAKDDENSCGYGSQLSLDGESKELSKKLHKDVKIIVAKIDKLDAEISALKGQLSDLSKKGGRFKAEFTKRMLGGTEQGKSILASLDGVRNIVKGIK